MRQGRGRVLAAVSAAVLGLAVVAVGHAATASVGLLKVRLGGSASETRIVLDLDQSVSGKLISDGSADGRVVLMLPGVSADGLQQGGPAGLVRGWSVEPAAGGARLQVDLASTAKVKRRFLLPPADGIAHYRYVLDLDAGASPVALTKATAPAAKVRTVKARTAPLSLKKVIVIDAGHGGHDPGARGAVSYEKDLNLSAAQTLKARLERTGRYRVVMTRDSDVYVPLENRVRIAQRANADLFISLHSDAGPNASLSGASVYTLSDKASARGQKFVSRDDWFMKASLTNDTGVRDILFDLTQRATRNRSASFAQMLVANIEGNAPLLRRSQRDAGFMVLLSPNVPAVLLEMGFVTNLDDEQFLRDPQSRGRLMGAVANSIDEYFEESTRLAAR